MGRLFALALVTAVVASPGEAQQLPAEARAAIDEVFAEYDRTTGPGCAVGVVQDSRLVYERGYGIGQMDHAIPLSGSSVFYLASVSKQFTAAAVLIAEHEGFLSLDDPVQKHIADFPDYEEPVTVRHLIHHTGGVRDYLTLMILSGISVADVLTDEEMLGLITRQRALNFEPGSRYLYTNSGYVLLAEIVERATGRSLRQYSEEKIFGPLGMTSTHFHDDNGHIVANRVFSYDRDSEGTWRTNYLMNFDKVGDGGLYSSVEDLARWDRAFYADVLGMPDFADTMYRRGALDDGEAISYAAGLGIGERRGLRRVTHGGGLMAFRTMIARYPDQATTVITLCNDGSASSAGLSAGVEDVVLAEVFTEDAPDPPEPFPASSETDEVSMPASALERFEGSYYSESLGMAWVLAVEEGRLMAHHPVGATIQLQPSSETRFRGGGMQFEFDLSGDEAIGFVVDAGRALGLRFVRSPQ